MRRTGNANAKIREIEARTILVRSRLPDADYVVNPYTGCEFGCLYCYASFMGRFVGEPVGAWGDYVYVKTNAVSLLEGELCRWSPKRRRASLLLEKLFERLAATGVGSLYVEHLNLRPYIRERMWHALKDEPAEVREVYRGASTKAHRQALDALVNELVGRHRLRLRLADVLDHGSGKRPPTAIEKRM